MFMTFMCSAHTRTVIYMHDMSRACGLCAPWHADIHPYTEGVQQVNMSSARQRQATLKHSPGAFRLALSVLYARARVCLSVSNVLYHFFYGLYAYRMHSNTTRTSW
jgi:hypothetical protein